jgi:hypothetical protein
MAEDYSYLPLSSPRNIRVIILQPSRDRKAELRCSLEEISIDASYEPKHRHSPQEISRDATDKPKRRYDALSYVWGAKVGTVPVLCERKRILVTPNCEMALRHLRHAKKSVTIWIDTICINQGDDIERAQQVPLMHDIYYCAYKIFIWLGEGTKEIARCFSRIWISVLLSNYHVNFERRLERLPVSLARKVVSKLGMCQILAL